MMLMYASATDFRIYRTWLECPDRKVLWVVKTAKKACAVVTKLHILKCSGNAYKGVKRYQERIDENRSAPHASSSQTIVDRTIWPCEPVHQAHFFVLCWKL